MVNTYKIKTANPNTFRAWVEFLSHSQSLLYKKYQDLSLRTCPMNPTPPDAKLLIQEKNLYWLQKSLSNNYFLLEKIHSW
jgi:hypothetical protein